MYLTVPTWLLFLFLCLAAFAPLVSRWPDWWLAYYGALFVCWALLALTAIRRVALEHRIAQRRLATVLTQLRDTRDAEAEETPVEAESSPPDEVRLIVVAREKADVYDRLRREQLGEGPVTVITDRRSTDRRRQLGMYIPDRRRAERRRRDIAPLLRAQGWAQVTLPRG